LIFVVSGKTGSYFKNPDQCRSPHLQPLLGGQELGILRVLGFGRLPGSLSLGARRRQMLLQLADALVPLRYLLGGQLPGDLRWG